MKNIFKSSKNTGFLFIIFAVFMGLLAVGISYIGISSMTKKYPMYIAAREIEIGDPLKKEDFVKIQIPKGGIPKDAVPIDTDLTGYIAIKDMSEKDILRKANIADVKQKDLPLMSSRLKYLSYTEEFKKMPEQKRKAEIGKLRAAEIPIKSIVGILPNMKKGDKVVVTSVYLEDIQDPQDSTKIKKIRRTETIFDHVYVLGINPPSDKSKGALVLALTQRQFEALALAREKGKFYIAVMPYGLEKPEGHKEIISDKYVKMLDEPESLESLTSEIQEN